MAEGSRKPDYNLWMASDQGKGRVGAAWSNEDGSISITLDPYVILKGKGHTGLKTNLMLFPYGGYEERKKRKEKRAEANTAAGSTDLDDDIPF
jgi:hypothetical protein